MALEVGPTQPAWSAVAGNQKAGSFPASEIEEEGGCRGTGEAEGQDESLRFLG